MRVQSDDGEELNAEFNVEADGNHLYLVMESAGGRRRDEGRARNDQYVPALRLLLSRLHVLDAVLLDGMVESHRTLSLTEAQRRIIDGPIRLSAVSDIENLRLAITSRQGHVNLPADAKKPGNNRKRIKLKLAVPGYGHGDAVRLARDLATRPTAPDPAERISVDAQEVLSALVDIPLHTESGLLARIRRLDGEAAVVTIEGKSGEEIVPVADVQRGLDRLLADSAVAIDGGALGIHSSVVGAALATLPRAVFSADTDKVVLASAEDESSIARKGFADLDGFATTKVRREQRYLRDLLLAGRELAPCALCGDMCAKQALVAAHIKKRAECSRDERSDFRNVAMLACMVGCDLAYEQGWITVDGSGVIHASASIEMYGRLAELLRLLDSSRCTAHSPRSEPYFAWHRDKHARVAPS